MLLTPLQTPLRRTHLHLPDVTSKYTALFAWGLRISDLAVVVVAGLCAHWLRFGQLDMGITYERAIVRGFTLALIVFSASPLYRSWRGRGMAREWMTMVTVYTALFVVGAIYISAMRLSADLSRLWRLEWYLACLVGGTAVRILIRRGAAYTRSRGMDVRTAVLVGDSNDAHRIIAALHQNSWAGILMLGRFQSGDTGLRVDGVPYMGDVDDLAEYVALNHVDQVWIALPMSEQKRINRILEALVHSTADIKFVPDLFGLQLLNHSVEQIAGLPVINLQHSPLQGEQRLWKALEDRLIAALILVCISPLMVLISVAVKTSSPGPVFYRQERVSWNNTTFQMLKFRSMPVDAEATSGAVWARVGEARATRVGRFLRRTSLDELPQFINVLRGEMSIVGPRPERPVFVEKFKHEIPAYMKKHMVKAGITGWAQVNGWRGSSDLKRRIECDLFYIENWSLVFDLKIILMTLFKGFVHKNAY